MQSLFTIVFMFNSCLRHRTAGVSAAQPHGAKPRPLIKSRSAAERLDQPLINRLFCPDNAILTGFSGSFA
jgi:hypothetical protein